MRLYLVAKSTIPEFREAESFRHVLFTKFSVPKRCFAWFAKRRRREQRRKK